LPLPFCPWCGRPAVSSSAGCPDCLRHGPWHFEWARAAYAAKGVVKEGILRLKYRGELFWLTPLADWLEEGFRFFAAFEQWDALVPVPIHAVRMRERGFNQAEELARMLGQRQGIALWNCLRKIRPTLPQASLPRAQRLENLAFALVLQRGFDLKDRSLLIVDDILTTGTTADACARILKEGGAKRVAVLTVARA
jgi:ComF family protein